MTDSQSQPVQDETIHHVSNRKKRGRQGGPMQLNLTSMIDVIFLLLIYFVITANFAVDEGVLTVKLPQGQGTPPPEDQPPPPPKDKLNIEIAAAGSHGFSIAVDGQRLSSFTDLQKRLAELQFDLKRGRNGMFKPDDPVIIKPQGRVRWQHVVNAFNSAVKMRYSNVAFSEAQ